MPALDPESDSDGPFSRLLAKRNPVYSESSGSSIAAATKQRKISSSASNSGSRSSSESLDEGEDVEHAISLGTKPLKAVVEINQSAEFDAGNYPELPGAQTIVKVLKDRSTNDVSRYEVRYGDGFFETISFDRLIKLDNGAEALERFELGDNSDSEAGQDEMIVLKGLRNKAQRNRGYVDYSGLDIADVANDSDELAQSANEDSSDPASQTEDGDEDEEDMQPRRSRRVASIRVERRPERQQASRSLRSSHRLRNRSEIEEDSDTASSNDLDILVSDIIKPSRKRKKTVASSRDTGASESNNNRRSDRNTTRRDMREIGEDQIERSSSSRSPLPKAAPKISGARESFQPLPRGDAFRERHMQSCDTCGHTNNSSGFLVFCQGCSLAYHRGCLGPRGGRDHLVTKVGDQEFALQCRRCINTARRKDDTAPDLSKCQDCHRLSESAQPFRSKKTPVQEHREREENDGEDPIVPIRRDLINNAKGLLFRCTTCSRGWHFHHLPSRDMYSMDLDHNDKERADARFLEYSKDWKCQDCASMPAKIQLIVAWRPVDPESYNPGVQVEFVEEDEKEYLVKFNELSYFQAEWKSGAWVWGVTQVGTRKSFFKKCDGPKMTSQDAIPEEFLRIDIVLDVRYSSKIDIRTEDIDRARIKEVDKALIKYKGLGYEDAVWERVPKPEDGDRWTDFVSAYNDWVLGRYTNLPKGKPLQSRLEKMRANTFDKLEKKKQPETVVGGELMKYQIDGMNWMFYQFFKQKNGILADEMGLGKTIQVIAFLTMLIDDWNVFPFLIVVPNSTVPNWRREIKKWAPHLRVVTYFGSSTARDMASRYELYPDKSSSIRCHIVVTSYEAAADENCRRFFRSVPWQGLIVDEGQRLKSDKTILHDALNALKAPFRLLLTGTPLQNNIRELFNLMQFLDDSVDAADMEQTHADMTNEDIAKIHELVRPMILRRTKAQVLTFLPPMGQIIVPVSMTMVQQKVYKSILTKNPELLKAIFSTHALKPAERASMNNVLMQLRKALCHPYIYSEEIEERHLSAALLHRNLVEASAKLEFLELILPKLKEKGHRVLIFSQFLGMLTMVEDFLDGLQLRYQRLDGSVSSLERQKRIDEFNAKDSLLFAFLLSTRAGGVGINLATADTVIILDPDFNPHQDLQAISRAHRIGQEKKVVCYQLMTRNSAEEKIVQMGRRKIALDHVVVDQLDAEDLEEKDVASILRHGAQALFADDSEQAIKYDDASIERLLDRSQIENTKTGADDSAQSQFSFARVWANDQETLQEDLGVVEDVAPDPSVWDKILRDREKAAADEAARKAEAFGRGRRAKQTVDYTLEDGAELGEGSTAPVDAIITGNETTPVVNPIDAHSAPPAVSNGRAMAPLPHPKVRRKRRTQDDSDTDFMAETTEDDDDELKEPFEVDRDIATIAEKVPSPSRGLLAPWQFQPNQPASSPRRSKTPIPLPPLTSDQIEELRGTSQQAPQTVAQVTGRNVDAGTAQSAAQVLASRPKQPNKPTGPRFKRATLEPQRMPPNPLDRKALMPNGQPYPPMKQCPACVRVHPVGSCPIKLAGVEHCGLCGIAHFGHARVCPHVRSETQVKLMIEALKQSAEPKHLVEAAMKYLRGVKGTLVQHKKQVKEKAAAKEHGTGPASAYGQLNVAPTEETSVEERLLAALHHSSNHPISLDD